MSIDLLSTDRVVEPHQRDHYEPAEHAEDDDADRVDGVIAEDEGADAGKQQQQPDREDLADGAHRAKGAGADDLCEQSGAGRSR